MKLFAVITISPGLNDTTVEATARVSLGPATAPDRDAGDHQASGDDGNDAFESCVADRLAAGLGVEPERVALGDPPG